MLIFSTLRCLPDVLGVRDVFKELKSWICKGWLLLHHWFRCHSGYLGRPWVPWSSDFRPHPRNLLSLRENYKVADLIDQDSGSWNHSCLTMNQLIIFWEFNGIVEMDKMCWF
ncbi:hypothetical protein PanWU01x14_056310 [Parasponia andersonii]|uniref:Uncharacterized protein n=1 Tax=Parasponia andersonii TaxID=3476 RepID=A0A2P5DKE6_PARAD|nr:hypothetical protein PanWU01x14_056310 [Parasponia andersonii]